MMKLPPELLIKIGEKLHYSTLAELSQTHSRFHDVFQDQIKSKLQKEAMRIHQSLPANLQLKVPVRQLIQFGSQYPQVNLKQFMWQHYYARHPLKLTPEELDDPSVLMLSRDINDVAFVFLRMIPNHTPSRLLPRYDKAVDQILNVHENADVFSFLMLYLTGFVLIFLFREDISRFNAKNKPNQGDALFNHILFMLAFVLNATAATIQVTFNNEYTQKFHQTLESFYPSDQAEKEYQTFLKAIYQELHPLRSCHFLDAKSRKIFDWCGMGPIAMLSPALLYGAFLWLLPLNVLGFLVLLIISAERKTFNEATGHTLLLAAAFTAPSFLLLGENYTLPLTEEILDCGELFCPAAHLSLSLTTTLGIASCVITQFLYDKIQQNAAHIVEEISNVTHNTVNYLYRGYRNAKQWMRTTPGAEQDPESGLHHRVN